VTSPQEPASDTSDRIAQLKALQADADALNKEISALNMQETQLAATINEKRNEKTVWNKYQMIQLENELKPLSDELRSVQKKKIELLEQKAALENQISELKK
jgi:chromosome segregation ATPase